MLWTGSVASVCGSGYVRGLPKGSKCHFGWCVRRVYVFQMASNCSACSIHPTSKKKLTRFGSGKKGYERLRYTRGTSFLEALPYFVKSLLAALLEEKLLQ